MQQENPQFYQSLAGHLSADEQAIVQHAVSQAETVAAQHAAQAGQQGSPGVPANGGAQ